MGLLIDTIGFNQNIANIIRRQLSSPTPPRAFHGHGEGETEPVEVDFGDDVNDIRGSVLVVTPTPEPKTYILVLASLLGCVALRRKRQAT